MEMGCDARYMRLGVRQFRKILSFTALIVSDCYWPGPYGRAPKKEDET